MKFRNTAPKFSLLENFSPIQLSTHYDSVCVHQIRASDLRLQWKLREIEQHWSFSLPREHDDHSHHCCTQCFRLPLQISRHVFFFFFVDAADPFLTYHHVPCALCSFVCRFIELENVIYRPVQPPWHECNFANVGAVKLQILADRRMVTVQHFFFIAAGFLPFGANTILIRNFPESFWSRFLWRIVATVTYMIYYVCLFEAMPGSVKFSWLSSRPYLFRNNNSFLLLPRLYWIYVRFAMP